MYNTTQEHMHNGGTRRLLRRGKAAVASTIMVISLASTGGIAVKSGAVGQMAPEFKEPAATHDAMHYVYGAMPSVVYAKRGNLNCIMPDGGFKLVRSVVELYRNLSRDAYAFQRPLGLNCIDVTGYGKASVSISNGNALYDTILIKPEQSVDVSISIRNSGERGTVYEINAAPYSKRAPYLSNPSIFTGIIEARAYGIFRESGSWNAPELKRLQEYYYKNVTKNYSKFVIDGVPVSIIAMMPTIKEVAGKYKVNPYLVAGVICSESFGYEYAIGKDDEIGVMQLDRRRNRRAAKALGRIDSRLMFYPKYDIDIGTKILKDSIEKFHGNVREALEAYNAGARAVYRNRVPKSTKAYADSTIRYMRKIESMYEKPVDTPK
ncbi:MAG: transglycosylase SLT domain-containing protein [Candidatus Micrarchaeaceae archaeon]